MPVFCGYCGAPMGQPHWDMCPLHDKEEVVQSLAGDVLKNKDVINNTRSLRSDISHARAEDDGPLPSQEDDIP